MQSGRVLLIGGWHLLAGLNHRVRHMAAYFEGRFASLDIVGYKKMYGGTPASVLTKLRIGWNHLLHDRVHIDSQNGTRHITIRDLYAPSFVEMGIKDLWRYWNNSGARVRRERQSSANSSGLTGSIVPLALRRRPETSRA